MTIESIGRVAPGPTMAAQVYDRLKRDLLCGAFAPGAALLTRELLERYGCGISPLREALARLAGEGFLVASGRRGVRVPLPSMTDLDELYRLRALLEGEALALAMQHGDDRWEAAAISALHRLERAPLPAGAPAEQQADQVAEWETRHRDFHAALIAAAPSPRLLRLVELIVEQTERYRALRLMHSTAAQLSRDIKAEHRALLELVIARDPAAIGQLRDHLDRTRIFIAQLFERGRRGPDREAVSA